MPAKDTGKKSGSSAKKKGDKDDKDDKDKKTAKKSGKKDGKDDDKGSDAEGENENDDLYDESNYVSIEQAVTLSRLELLAAEHQQWLDAVMNVMRKGSSSLSTFLAALGAVRSDVSNLDQRRDALTRNRATCRASLSRLREISHLLSCMDANQLPRPADKERHSRIASRHPLIVTWYVQALRKLDEADAILSSPVHASFYVHILLHLMEALLMLRCLSMSPYTLAQCVACYYLPVGLSYIPLVQLLSPDAIPFVDQAAAAGGPGAVAGAESEGGGGGGSMGASEFLGKPWYEVAPDAVKASVTFAHIAPSLRLVETISEAIARELVQRYWVQIDALTPSSVADVGDATTLRVLLALHKLPPVMGKIGDSSVEQSVATMIACRVSAPKVCDRTVHKPVAAQVSLRAVDLQWTEDGFFEKPGVRTNEGRLYSGGVSEPHTYFYRAGSAVEAQSLGMSSAEERVEEARQEVEAAALRRSMAVADSEQRSRLLELSHAAEVDRLSSAWATRAAQVWSGAIAAHHAAPRGGRASVLGATARSDAGYSNLMDRLGDVPRDGTVGGLGGSVGNGASVPAGVPVPA